MKQELEQKLYKDFPEIFKYVTDLKLNHRIISGLDCGNGWYKLINRLCGYVQGMIDRNPPMINQQMRVRQIKEKYGGLRFHYEWVVIKDRKIPGVFDIKTNLDGCVDFAMNMSEMICEECGSSEGVNKEVNGWWSTQCKTCREKDTGLGVDNGRWNRL